MQTASRAWINTASAALAVLAFINLFNYLDRYLLAALVVPIQKSELALTDEQLGFLQTAFLIVFALVAPLFGALGDRGSRTRLIALGVGCWSVATALSGLASSYLALFAARAAVGVGEAAYVTIAPSLLSDYFPRAQRGRVMAIFFCGIPVGSALGYVLGGLMEHYFGWRSPFSSPARRVSCSRCSVSGCATRRAAARTRPTSGATRVRHGDPAHPPIERCSQTGPTCSRSSDMRPTRSRSEVSPSGCRHSSSAPAASRASRRRVTSA